jgi:hypothetical protein
VSSTPDQQPLAVPSELTLERYKYILRQIHTVNVVRDLCAAVQPRLDRPHVASARDATMTVFRQGGSDTHIAIAFSPDGDTLTTVVANATVSRRNVTDPHAVTRLSVHI